ncbi:MAG: hydroxyacid dehydrogenase [bacterium]
MSEIIKKTKVGSPMKKVLLSQPIQEAGMKLLEGKVEIIIAPDTSEETMRKLCRDVHGIVLRTTSRVGKEVIAEAKSLQIISRTGAGVDNVDVQAATKRGILVCNLPGVNSLSVAEHTVTFILALAKRLRSMDESTRRGNWSSRNRYEAVDLKGKVLGLIGVGKIGSRVAKMCQSAFNMKILGYDPFISQGGETKWGIRFCREIRWVFEEADFVSVHVSGTAQTRNLIGWDLLSRMKKSAYFINTSRGGVVDEEALTNALKEGKIAGAALDVFSEEPPSKNNPLLEMENILLSPHSASLTKECVVSLARGAAQAILDFFSGKLPENIFNRKGLEEAGFIKEDQLIKKA